MPAFLEAKLKKEYGAKSSVPYKIMNEMGAMKGPNSTAKGRAMQKKHDAKGGKTTLGAMMGHQAKPKDDEED